MLPVGRIQAALWFVGLSTGGGWQSSVWAAPPSTDNTIWRECVSGDFNGDGRTDLACYSQGQWKVGLSTGTKFEIYPWGSSPSLDGCAVADFVGQGQAALGCKQLAVSTSSGWLLSDWSKATLVTGDAGNCFLGDFNGDGRTDFACNAGGGNWALTLSSGPAPDLLVATTDSLGATTHVAYGYSTNYSNTQLPFPVNTVESIISDDGRGVVLTKKLCYTSTFCYHGGLYDLLSREFRGFSDASVVTEASATNDGNIQQSWYFQGNETIVGPNDPNGLVGRLRRNEIRDLSSQRLLRTTSIEYAPNKGSPPYFNPPKRVDAFTCSYGSTQCDDTDHSKHVTTGYKYEPVYGNLLETTFVDRDDKNYDSTISRSYTEYKSAWIVGLIAEETKFQGILNPIKVASVSFSYDDVGDDCSPLRTPVTNPRGNLTTVTRWLDTDAANSPSTLIGYNDYGSPVCLRDARGHIAHTSYDANYVLPTAFTNALGYTTTLKYYGIDGTALTTGLSGQLAAVIDPNGVSLNYEYDTFGRLASIKRGDGSADHWTYNNLGNPAKQNIQVESKSGLSHSVFFDGMGRTWRTLNTGPEASFIAVDTKFASSDRASEASLPYFIGKEKPSWARMTFDALGRIKTITRPDNSQLSYCYADWSTWVIDQNGHLKKMVRDAFGRVTRAEEFRATFPYDCNALLSHPPPPYAITVQQYDTLGNRRITTDAKGNQITWSYDSLSRVTKRMHPDTGEKLFEYDANGNLVREEDALHDIRESQYDQLDRIVRQQVLHTQSKPENASYFYDAGPYGIGRLSALADPQGIVKLVYEPLGRVVQKTRSIGKKGYAFNTTYDLDGRVNTFSYPDGNSIRYVYTGPFLAKLLGPHGEEYYTASSYTAVGQPRFINYGNGLDSQSSFYEPTNKQCSDANYRLCAIEVFNRDGVEKSLSYKYDGKGNVQSIKSEGGRAWTFGYDELDRIITQQVEASSLSKISMSYDQIGNLTSYSPVGNYVYPGKNEHPHAVTKAGPFSFQYDDSGNLSRGANRELGFDVNGRLTKVVVQKHEGGSFWWLFPRRRKTEFGYAWDGSRLFVKADKVLPYPLVLLVPKKRTDYLGNLYECRGRKCDLYLFADGKPVMRLDHEPKESRYYHSDVISSIRYVSDMKGRIVQTFDYQPFGGNDGSRRSRREKVWQQFTGQTLDESTGLYYYQSRYYDPAIGRFISQTLTSAPSPIRNH